MTRLVMGDLLSDEAAARWDALSSVDKMTLIRAHQRETASKKVSVSQPKPANWDRGSSLDKRTWYLQQQRESEG